MGGESPARIAAAAVGSGWDRARCTAIRGISADFRDEFYRLCPRCQGEGGSCLADLVFAVAEGTGCSRH